MAVVQNYLPGDPLLIDKIVYELKSQGIFDQFRKECIADVDTKPAYQNLRQRVEGSVSGFLNKQKWSPDMNKNQLREMLRKNIYESGFLETGVERIVDQVVNPKINSIFLPKVTEVVYKFLGIEKKSADDRNLNLKLPSNNDNLLPTDLEAVSPESEKRFNISNNSSSQNLDDSKIDEDESPPFEPLEEKPVYTIAPEENSMDSHLSGFSGLMSHDSNHSQEISKTTQMEVSNQDSTISKQSSEGRLSIVMSDDNDTKMEICDDSLQQKPHKTQAKNFNFQTDLSNNTTTGRKSDNKQEDKSSKSTKKDDKYKSKHDKDGKKDDKDSRRSEKERKEHKHSSKDKDRERKDSSKSGRSDSKSDRNKSSTGRHSTSNRSSSKKEASSSSKERSKSSSSTSKDKESKHKDDKTKHSSSKHESRSDKHKKDDKHKSDRHSSSSSKSRDKKDPKKDKKENKDDHFSSKKRTDRRSTDRDSNDGHSGLKSSSSSFDSYSSTQTQAKGQESSNSNSTNSNNGSGGDSNSDCVEGITTALGMAPLKLIKPKFASNIHEARRLMKIRKQINLLEKQNLLNAAKLITQKLIENKRKSIENEKKPNSPEIKRKDPSPPPLSPPLKSSIVSAATWDALEAKLHESINYTTRYDGLENDDSTMDEQEIVIQNKDDCLYLKDDNDEKVERYRKFTSEYITSLENSIEGTSSQPAIKKDIPDETLRDNNINKGVKRKFSDYNSDLKNNNNNKKFNTHHIEVHENFSLPLSPAESDNSIDKKSDMSDSSDKAVKKIETELVVKRTNRGASNNQRYSSEELYKPRLMFGGSRRRKGRNLGLD